MQIWCFQSKKATGDYHDEMKAAYVEEWFHASLLLNLQSNSLIVMDNALYHRCKLEPMPTMSSTKQQMQHWLTAKGIVFSECFEEGIATADCCEQSHAQICG